MGYRLLALGAIVAAGIVALRISQLSRMRRLSMHRVGIHTEEETGEPFAGDEQYFIAPYPRRYYFAGPLAAALTAGAILLLTKLPTSYPCAFGVLAGVFVYQLEIRWRDTRIERVEGQLADAIDLMVSSLRAGSALLGALESSYREARSPIREEFENMVGRIRLGEDPQSVVRELPVRIPLESFRLFAYSLLVHWETGGSLATSLRTVGRTVRDRLEVSRRISAQAIESQVSVGAVMFIAYAMTALTFITNPGPITKLVYSPIGSYVAAAAICLQAVGMFWIWNMSRIRF
jgi:tight adherence protein B